MKMKSLLQSQLVALKAIAGDKSKILAWPDRGLGVAFDGAGNPATVTLDKAAAVTPSNEHRLIPDGNRVSAILVTRDKAIATYLPILEKKVAEATDDPDPVTMEDKPWSLTQAVPTRPVMIPEPEAETETHADA